jgi:beta-lactamase regulating signal transducer with metallopeptidase domain
MTPDIEALNRLARAWMGLAWAVAWQSTLLVGVFALVALGMRRSSPSLRYWFWQIAAIKLLVMPLWSVSILLPATPPRGTSARMDSWPAARSGGEIGLRPEDRRLARDQDAAPDGLPHEGQASGPWIARVEWQAWLFLGWGLAVVSQTAAIAHQRSRLERLLRQAAPGDDPALLALVVELSGRIGLRRRPSVMIIDDEGSPFVCGLWRPSLVLPRGLTRSLDLESLRSVLLHELAHIRRRDLLWDWIPAIARLLYFFHPAAHFIVARARLDRELACDQTAMVLTGLGAAGYASTLVEIVSRSSAPPALRAALAVAGLDGAAPSPARCAGIEITPS